MMRRSMREDIAAKLKVAFRHAERSGRISFAVRGATPPGSGCDGKATGGGDHFVVLPPARIVAFLRNACDADQVTIRGVSFGMAGAGIFRDR